jgi:hypothetical protein
MSSEWEDDVSGEYRAGSGSEGASGGEKAKKNGGWREIEARREKAALKASLADVWDEDFDLDEEILAELDHTAEYFTQQDDVEEEVFVDDDDDDADEFFDDDEV